MSIELRYGPSDYILKPDQLPEGPIEEAQEAAEIAWYLTTSAPDGSDHAHFIPAEQKDKSLVAVIVDKGRYRFTYNQGLTGVFINKPASTVTIVFTANNIPDYLTLDYNPQRVFFIYLKKDSPNSSVENTP